jgi:hypothetical protein
LLDTKEGSQIFILSWTSWKQAFGRSETNNTLPIMMKFLSRNNSSDRNTSHRPGKKTSRRTHSREGSDASIRRIYSQTQEEFNATLAEMRHLRQQSLDFAKATELLNLQASQEINDVVQRFTDATLGHDGLSRTEPVLHRTSEVAIAQMPRARILRDDKKRFAHDESECSICGDHLITGVCLSRLDCGHVFHLACSVKWLNKSNTCPECRYEVEAADPTYEIFRKEKMKDRKVVCCVCHPSKMHSCFFTDPTKPLTEQVLSCQEVHSDSDSDLSCEAVDPIQDKNSMYFE